jgi:hypothetical protein
MPLNPLVFLNNEATASAAFQAALAPGDRAIFLVLGDTAAHQTLANAALPKTFDFRLVIRVVDPDWINGDLTALNIAVDPPVPSMDQWFAICINFSSDIVEIYTDDSSDNITPCFLLASSKSE